MAGTSETPEDSPASPDDINSRLAEIAAELASEARFKEPSAAERARARVTAVRAPAKPKRRSGPLGPWRARRARRKAEELRAPLRPAGAPAPEPPPRPSRLARRAAARASVPDRGYADVTMPSRLRSGTTIVIIMVLLIGVSIGLRYLIRHYANAPARPALHVTRTTGPRSTPTTTPAVTPSTAATFNPADPFAGTPAEKFATGAAGIVPPPATTTGQFSAAEVRAAYTTTRELLIAGYLDPATLTGGRPTAFADLMDTTERAQFLRDLNRTGKSATGQLLSTRDWVNSFASGTVLVGGVIKVHGRMTAGTARSAGRTVLRIRTDYLFVYAVEKKGDAASGLRVVNRVVMTVDFAPFDTPASSALVAHVYTITGGPTGVQCGTTDGYVHPAFPGGGPAASPRPTGTPINPYDQATAPPANLACAPTTGT